ncbi:tyrosyl-DNA phosphodiesterase 1 [Lepidopterella palustris CBS 459.81]|uniref:Tyrosyl-DNA phosphodiesterase 1 n=1 Tax=Lepidopterella palustris CBS 459.81 TaxID=1314670 RepID=A0A8E2ELG2_9PEZI|nr:tyrosyl-DNA phosphodiesterase 1 [Lepidopterella palustris CBS 459.81]
MVDDTKCPLASLQRAISPPLGKGKKAAPSTTATATITSSTITAGTEDYKSFRYVPSPIQLMQIRDLSAAENVDTIGLTDILGDPLIKECWQFNYLFDLDFLMSVALDPDVKNTVQVKVVHGSWKKEDSNRLWLEKSSKRYPNVQLITAHMPEPFGTHHSKMMILIRHDDCAQVIIHTANMISKDWANMTQAIWRSPLLPLSPPHQTPTASEPKPAPIGSGHRFKTDLLRYLDAYGNRLRALVVQLTHYDFASVRAALIASTPSRQRPAAATPTTQTSWGWLGLGEILSGIPVSPSSEHESPPNIVMQVSSIATLGQTNTWLVSFQSTLSRCSSTSKSVSQPSPFSIAANSARNIKPTFNLIFPTPPEIRLSLDGYAAGGSIHIRLQSAAHQKQLAYLKPLLCHWSSQSTSSTPIAPNLTSAPTSRGGDHPGKSRPRKAHRGPAAPHIKTYIRFSSSIQDEIDWAMVTSANLSMQAWGSLPNKENEIKVSSWEIGVVVWPGLWKEEAENGEEVSMVPVFGKDAPSGDGDACKVGEGGKVVGFRMPYDLPLVPYASDEMPWCATAEYDEPDWRGVMWK